MSATRAGWLGVLLLGELACSEPAAAPPAPPTKPVGQTVTASALPAPPVTTPAPWTAAASSPSSRLEPLTPPAPEYSPRGRRDPFEPAPSPKVEVMEATSRRRSIIASAKLTGIVSGPDGPLVLVEMPDGIGYILRPGDGIAEGRLIQIGRDSAVFDVPPKWGLVGEQIILALGPAT